MEKTKISIDAPKNFLDPHRSAQEFYKRSGTVPEPAMSLSQMHKKPGTCCTLKPDPYAASLVLPGGRNLYEATIRAKEITQNTKSDRRMFPHGKQVLINSILPFSLVMFYVSYDLWIDIFGLPATCAQQLRRTHSLGQ